MRTATARRRDGGRAWREQVSRLFDSSTLGLSHVRHPSDAHHLYEQSNCKPWLDDRSSSAQALRHVLHAQPLTAHAGCPRSSAASTSNSTLHHKWTLSCLGGPLSSLSSV